MGSSAFRSEGRNAPALHGGASHFALSDAATEDVEEAKERKKRNKDEGEYEG
jgi:hypothetical protein